MPTSLPRISVTLDRDSYNKVKIIAHKQNRDMSDLIREWTIQGMNGELTEKNLEIIVPIIREQIKNVIEPMLERSISLTAKTCIQAGTAAYLSADSILKFVPKEQREDVRESYEKARKQAIEYTRSKVRLEADE